MKGLICVLAAAGLAGCASELHQVNQSLAAVNQALAASSQPRTMQNTMNGPAIPKPTSAQSQALQSQRSLGNVDTSIAATRQEAWPTIEKLIGFVACYPQYNAARYLHQYLIPNAYILEVAVPMNSMNYHPKTQCVSIARMDNWSMPARNALAFRTVYVSESSGESQSYNYEMVKQPDGAWLYRRVGF